MWTKLRGSGCGQNYEEVVVDKTTKKVGVDKTTKKVDVDKTTKKVGVVKATMNPLCRQGYQTHR